MDNWLQIIIRVHAITNKKNSLNKFGEDMQVIQIMPGGKKSIFSKWPHTASKINSDLPPHTECYLTKLGNNTMIHKITCRNQFKIKNYIFSNINLPLTLTNTLWSWSYGSWIYNYLFAISAYHHYHCEFESHSWRGVLATTLCDKVCQWIAAGRWLSPASSTDKTDRHDITEILLKVAKSP